MNMHGMNRFSAARRTRGVSLIELMVAIAIASLVTLGLIQIFGASRVSSQLQEGLSRVQESGRFATQYMQRNLRMVGFMGCGADTGRAANGSLTNHFSMFADGSVPSGNQYRFQRPMEAFTAGTMSRPEELTDETSLVEGSDVLVLRVLSEESAPILTLSKAGAVLTATIGEPDAAFLPEPNDTVVLAMQNCRSANIFAGMLNGTTPGSGIVVDGAAEPNVYQDPTCGNCPWGFRVSNATFNAKALVGEPVLNAEVHRGEYIALFVKPSTANPGINSLWVRRFERNSTALGAAEELVEGIDNMQLRFGYDTSTTPDAQIDEYRTAAEVIAGSGSPTAIDDAWRRVLNVRIGFLVRSPGVAGVGANDDGTARTYELLGTTISPPNDRAIREVYETTIALRNRLFNS
jgi:type IV pilus assembly protein PilW